MEDREIKDSSPSLFLLRLDPLKAEGKHRRHWLLTLCLLAWMGGQALGQTATVDAAPGFCYDPASPVAIGNFFSILGDDNIVLDGLQITITENYDAATDLLTFNNSNGISGNFDATNGILTLSGSNDLVAYRQVLDEVFFSSNATAEAAKRSITISLSNLDFLPETGHFYQYVPSSGILWNDARLAASAQELFGLTGYLATITSSAESQFLIERVAGSAWIGATDEAQEGVWRWVTGPEGLENGGNGRVISGFINWNDGEPNNCCGGEDFAHMMDWTSPPGRWNDLNNDSAPPGSPYHPTGYMIEYGGMPGDPNVFLEITGTTELDPIRPLELVGSTSLCPNLNGVPYTVESLEGYTYNWSVDGGNIDSGQGTSEIVVNWGPTNANAKVSVTAVSDVACETTVELPVTINVQLEPPLPSGPATVCFADLTTAQIYNTPETPGSNYEWKITNGQIISGNGTNEIEVLWDGPGIGTLFFTESTSTATDICDGDSPLLSIDLREEIVPTLSITNVSCFGGSDGAVVMANLTGAEPLTYTWNTAGQGSAITNGVENLPAGIYSVDITSNDCTINVPFTITQPDELQGSIEAFDALCFGQASGRANALVSGGTGAYTYNWSINRPTDQSAIRDLPMGNYSVEVVDENDCVLLLNFSIGEPPLLVIDDIVSTLVTCPQGTDGTLEAFVSGGTPPYTYNWGGSQDETALATGFAKGTYQLVVTDANGCTVEGVQTVEEATPKLFLPTAFSPNGDGDNDTFGPITTCAFNFSMIVYNRWGNPIFSTARQEAQWGGSFDGEPVPEGVYSYTAAWSIIVNDQLVSEERKGNIRLYR